MKSRRPINAFAPQEVRRFVAPLSLATVLFMMVIVLDGLFNRPTPNVYTSLLGIGGILHVLLYHRLIAKSPSFREMYGWINAIGSGIGLGLLIWFVSSDLMELMHILIVVGAIGIAAVSGRLYAVITLLIALMLGLVGKYQAISDWQQVLAYGEPFVLALVVMETYLRTKNTAQQQIKRLETINKASRRLMQSLDQEEALSLLSSTMTDTLEADSYFVGTLIDEHTIRLDLMYDEGEFYNGTELPIEGTLSGWIIKNQRELYLPDLREDVQLEGVEVRVIGKNKTSLSWIGVPLKATNITGIMAMASYKPNAFDLADMELLSSLAQHVTLALDNTIRHAQVEEQARLDSLTGVYNHGYFLKKLSEQAETTLINKTPLSLIMLDIDYFKQYNDTHGHLVGDQILNSLCTAIKQHIKQGDTVGRWGGEEFVISLPNATGEQAAQVAKRISETMMMLRVEDRAQRTVPVPTVSQGIAIFPQEANEIYRLIDLADRRLYVAKERGRNQIEPNTMYWSTPLMEKN
jgi:diguanylate cyclase (GGDEF)-like protein